MAYVKVHQIKATVGKAIRYITRPDATDQGRLVSTNCAVLDPTDYRAIEREFLETHTRQDVSGPRGSVLAHHVIQSFKPGEISDPYLAHRVGVEFARSITKGRHEYSVATHTDKGHVHNHIIFNAVSYETGRKFRMQRDTLAGFRRTSDELAREYGLSIIMPRLSSHEWGPGAVQAMARGGSPIELVKVSIDRALSTSKNWAEFERNLQSEGVRVGRSAKLNVTFQGHGMKYAARDDKFGAGYQEADLMARLGGQTVLRFDCHQSLVAGVRDDAVTLRLPGSHGSRFLAVHPDQVVRHGTTLRVYLPQQGQHAILNKDGKATAQVPNRALYATFTPPARRFKKLPGAAESGATLARGKSRKAQLARMHAQETILNARAKYGIVTSDQAIGQAVQLANDIERVSSRIQVLAIAVDEAPVTSHYRSDLEVRLAAANRDLRELDQSAGALLMWAQQLDRDAEKTFRQMTLAERLRGLSERDVESVNPVAAQERKAQERKVQQAEKAPAPDLANMSLRERLAYLKQRDREQQHNRQQQPNNRTEGRTR